MRIEKCGGDFCDYAMMEKKLVLKQYYYLLIL